MGEPLALELKREAEASRRRVSLQGGAVLVPRLREAVICYWLGESLEELWAQLRAVVDSEREQALVELLYGQLLTAVKRSGAIDALQHAFLLAHNDLDAEGYFEVLRRHEELVCLNLRDQPSEPQGLESLLTEAAVIRRMQGCPKLQSTKEPIDTLG